MTNAAKGAVNGSGPGCAALRHTLRANPATSYARGHEDVLGLILTAIRSKKRWEALLGVLAALGLLGIMYGCLHAPFYYEGIPYSAEAIPPMPPTPSSTASPKERFEYVVAAMDRMRMADRTNKHTDVTQLLKEILPRSDKIRDHLDFFKQIESSASRSLECGHKDHFYFSFSRDQLRRFGGAHLLNDDILFIDFTTTSLTDEASILPMKATFQMHRFVI